MINIQVKLIISDYRNITAEAQMIWDWEGDPSIPNGTRYFWDIWDYYVTDENNKEIQESDITKKDWNDIYSALIIAAEKSKEKQEP